MVTRRILIESLARFNPKEVTQPMAAKKKAKKAAPKRKAAKKKKRA